jgi:hypothetical protein
MTPRTPSRETLGHRVNEVFKRVHRAEPMPWQAHWNLVRLELVEGEKGLELAFPKAIATVPRQSGKTAEMLADVVDRGRNWAEEQHGTLTQQRGKDAVHTVIDKWGPRLQAIFGDAKDGGEVDLRKGNGNEMLSWPDGGSLRPLPPKEDAGHGETLDYALVDEAWAYLTNVVEQAVGPAMSTRPLAQHVIYSTQGTERSLYLASQVELGRETVDLEVVEGIAYLEYSAPEDCDPDDEDVWRACMPALGYTQTIRKIRAARQAMANEPGEFERAYLNIPQRSRPARPALDRDVWERTVGAERITGSEQWALFTGANRSSCAVARAGWRADGRVQLVVMEYEPGTGWVPDRLAKVLPGGIVGVDTLVDGSLIPELKRAKVRVKPLKTADAINAFAKLREYLADDKVRHARQVSLDEAAANTTTRRVRGEEAVLFKRIGAVDISPLVACSLALWMLISDPQKPKVPIIG